MTQNAAAGVLAEPFVIEIEVDGKWVQVGSDNNAEYVESRRRFLDTYIEGFADDLRKCGWSGPALGKIRVRDLRHTAPSFVQEHGTKGEGFKVTYDNLRHSTSTEAAKTGKAGSGCVYDTNGDGDCQYCHNRGGCANMGGPFSHRSKYPPGTPDHAAAGWQPQ